MRMTIVGPQISMHNIQHILVAVFLLLLSASAFGREQVTNDITEISLGVGYHNIDSKIPVENGGFATMGLGLHFSRRWALLLQYSNFFSTVQNSENNQSIYVQKYHVDGYYFFRPAHRLRPFMIFGFGQIDYDDYGGEKLSETLINIGVGVSYRMTAHWSVRGDVRIFDYINDRFYDDTLTTTFAYRFGGGEKGD